MISFNDAALDDPEALASADPWIRPLAEAGARLRRDADRALEELADVSSDGFRPRAVVAIGPEARLLRAVLELSCPVPFVAWSHHGLPAWVGPLDVVVVLGGPGSLGSASEALRRGCRLIVVAQPDSDLAMQTASRSTTLLPAATGDPLDGAVVALLALRRFGLAPEVDPHAMADAMDAVAEACSHSRDLSHNPARRWPSSWPTPSRSCGAEPSWRRGRPKDREAVRAASGRVALAADASDLAPTCWQPNRRTRSRTRSSRDAPQRLSLLIVSDGWRTRPPESQDDAGG